MAARRARCAVAVFDDLRRGLRTIEFLSDPGVGEIGIGGKAYFRQAALGRARAVFAARIPESRFARACSIVDGSMSRAA
jgi:hypothetical protein